MKIVHTADWHLGKIVHRRHMTEDQAFALADFVEWLAVIKPDALIIAGDIYDRSIPPVEAVELLNQTLTTISQLKIPTLIIAGNHDSPERLGFGQYYMEEKQLYIRSVVSPDLAPIQLMDVFGPVDFYLIPYLEPVVVHEIYGEEASVGRYDQHEAMQTVLKPILERIREERRHQPTKRYVAVVHGYVTGRADLERSDSERLLSIGGSEAIDVALFADFDYVALGHLHGPQKVGRPSIRYAGSLLKYSFSEAHHHKSAVICDLQADGQCQLDYRPYTIRRDMRVLTGKLEELLSDDYLSDEATDDYIKVCLTDERALIDPLQKLRQRYPNILSLEYVEGRGGSLANGDRKPLQLLREQTMEQLFGSFYETVTGKETMATDDALITLARTAMDETLQNRRRS